MTDSQYQEIGKNYLEHHGVKGMKWGVRRYQNADGTLTEAGKKKLSNYKEKQVKQSQKRYDKEVRRTLKYGSKRKSMQELTEKQRAYMMKQYTKRFNDEMKAIGKMKYKDMQKEKLAVGKEILKSAAITTGFHGAALAMGLPFALISFPDTYNAKLAVRIPDATRDFDIGLGASKIAKEYRQEQKEKERQRYLK